MSKLSYVKPKLYLFPNSKELSAETISLFSDERLGQYIEESKEIEYGKKYKANPDVLLRKIGDEYMLVPTGGEIELNGLITINETACFLWKQFQTPTTIPQVIANAKVEYSDGVGDMEREIRSFVDEYVRNKLIIEEENR